MGQIITATFEGGVFKPDGPLDLPQNTRVRLIVEPVEESTEAEREAEWEEFERLMDEITIDSGGPPPKRDELYDRQRY